MQDMTNPTGAPPPGTPGVAVSDRAVADGTLALIAEDEELLAALGAPRPSLATREAAAADVIMERLAHDEGFPSVAARQQAAHDMQIVAEAALADLIASGRAPQEWWQLEHETRVAYRLHQDRVPNAVITGGQLAILAQAIDAVWLAYLERLGVALPPHRLRTVIAKAAAATTEAA